MKFYLIVANGQKRGMPIAVKVDLFTMGSDAMCQLRSQLPGVGKQHCAFVTRERKVFIHDLDSGAETVVNGEIIPPGAECPLHAGDRVKVGPLEFMIQFKEKALSQRDAEEWALRCLDVDAEKEEDDERIKPQATNASSAAEQILGALRDQRGIVKGRLRIGHDEGITMIRFNDVYLVEEAELALVKRELLNNLKKPNQRVLLDFKNVRRLSSAAADMLTEVHRFLMLQGSSLAFCRLRPELRPALEARDLLQKIRSYADKKVAMTASW